MFPEILIRVKAIRLGCMVSFYQHMTFSNAICQLPIVENDTGVKTHRSRVTDLSGQRTVVLDGRNCPPGQVYPPGLFIAMGFHAGLMLSGFI